MSANYRAEENHSTPASGFAAGPHGLALWGRFGAAGLALVAETEGTILMQHRAAWTAQGNTWALPGGARELGETAVETAVRETYEEAGIDPGVYQVMDTYITAGPYPADPHRPELAGNWTYSTVIAIAHHQVPTIANEESLELKWVELAEVEKLPLLGAFAQSWPVVYEKILATRQSF
ncbi:NUDIX domain-containing protein [Corynebacterium kutscheri]|nr:NUDIX domain-containing protein [Corynebacterium kutscheri]VEH10349.1 NTP pyrophosphohydrolase [Corynebacterium kutscheri]